MRSVNIDKTEVKDKKNVFLGHVTRRNEEQVVIKALSMTHDGSCVKLRALIEKDQPYDEVT